VSAELDLSGFDTPRVARSRLRAVMAEVQRLRRADGRLVSARLLGRRDGQSSELRLTVAASSERQAFDLGSSMVRSAIHAAGDSTAGWDRIRPEVFVDHASLGHRWSVPASWADAALQTARRSVLPPLPAFIDDRPPPFPGVAVIDLR